jgi:hypothetical protein
VRCVKTDWRRRADCQCNCHGNGKCLDRIDRIEGSRADEGPGMRVLASRGPHPLLSP